MNMKNRIVELIIAWLANIFFAVVLYYVITMGYFFIQCNI